MSTIALKGNTFGYTLGVGSFTNLGYSFGNVKKSSESLSSALGSLKGMINTAKESVRIDTSQELIDNLDKCEKNKKSALTVAYDKLDAFVSDVGAIDSKVNDKINDRKDSFYDKYAYLKPKCEKSGKEKWNEFWNGAGEWTLSTLGGVWSVVKSFTIGIAEWCKEVFSNVISAATAIVIIVAAIVICIVCAPEIIAMIAIIVCAAAAIYGLVDIGFMVATGKDIPGFLEDKGHENWAAFFRGLDFGMTVASLILPVGATIKTAMKLGGKTFTAASKQWLKTSLEKLGSSFKNIGKNIKGLFKCSGKPGFKGVIQSIGMSLWKGFKGVTGIDDIARLKELRSIKGNKGWIISFNSEHWELDEDNMRLLPKSKEANDAIREANNSYKLVGIDDKVIDSLPLKKEGGVIDLDWDKISAVSLGKKDGFNMKNLDFTKPNKLRDSIYGRKDSRFNVVLNMNQGIQIGDPRYTKYSSNGAARGGYYNNLGFTMHENYNTITENVVPTFIHNVGRGGNGAGISHIGGNSRLNSLYTTVTRIDYETIARNIFVGITNNQRKTANN